MIARHRDRGGFRSHPDSIFGEQNEGTTGQRGQEDEVSGGPGSAGVDFMEAGAANTKTRRGRLSSESRHRRISDRPWSLRPRGLVAKVQR